MSGPIAELPLVVLLIDRSPVTITLFCAAMVTRPLTTPST